MRRIVGALVSVALAVPIAWLVQDSGLYGSVRNLPDAWPGVEWRDVAAYAAPLAILLWILVARRAETGPVVGALAVVALFVGHAWSNLDWTVFVARGIPLSAGGVPPVHVLVAFVVLFAALTLAHGLRRRTELRREYERKGAEEADLAEVVSRASRGGAAIVLQALVLALAAVGATASAFAPASAFALPRAAAVAVGVLAVATVAAGALTPLLRRPAGVT